MQPITTTHNEYAITTDKSLMNMYEVHQWLCEKSYWSPGISFEKVRTGFDNSFCIGALWEGKQVAFGRLITDYSSFAYLADVYVMEEHRGKGIGKEMMRILFSLDWVMQLRGIMLATRNAHDLYRQFGFTELPTPERFMKLNP